uniref:Toxin candidate TRINITY_DN28076_c5_g1_i4 n=1 Tax=Pachycerianthus borealis TaxID=2736680 RepID=A0A7G7WYY0_9CNID|nr:toxin candidate TRINITY_DN28076_c5_g1_i4 [Pachycerianthus borealis]
MLKITSIALLALYLFFTCSEVDSKALRGKGHGRIYSRAARSGVFARQLRGMDAGCPDADAALEEHNTLRAQHGAPALEWDDKLATEARDWANKMAADGQMEHSSEDQRPGEGENLAFQWVGLPELEQTVAEDSDKMWMDEEPLYSEDNPYEALHYTQMVWKDTKKFGIGCAKAGDMMYVAARYSPIGNMMGDFGKNVQ